MNDHRRTNLVTGMSLLAGAMDAGTGALLIVAPAWTLALLGATIPGGDSAAVLMRWIGVFVAGVGMSYLWALVVRRPQRLAGVWSATAIVRTGVAAFCAIAVATGALERIWLVVGITDAMLAGLQFQGLRRGWCGT